MATQNTKNPAELAALAAKVNGAAVQFREVLGQTLSAVKTGSFSADTQKQASSDGAKTPN